MKQSSINQVKLKSSLWHIIVANNISFLPDSKRIICAVMYFCSWIFYFGSKLWKCNSTDVSSSSDFFACIITLAIIASPHSVLKFSEKTKSCRFTDLLLCQRVPDYISWLLDQFYTYFHTCTKTLYFWYYFLNTLHLTLN